MNPNNREKQFELFGFDFLIDEDFRVWLIEANCNPYLAESNEYVAEILQDMIDEMIEISVDTVYEPKRKLREYVNKVIFKWKEAF